MAKLFLSEDLTKLMASSPLLTKAATRAEADCEKQQTKLGVKFSPPEQWLFVALGMLSTVTREFESRLAKLAARLDHLEEQRPPSID